MAQKDNKCKGDKISVSKQSQHGSFKNMSSADSLDDVEAVTQDTFVTNSDNLTKLFAKNFDQLVVGINLTRKFNENELKNILKQLCVVGSKMKQNDFKS